MKVFKNKHIIEVSPDTYKTMYKRLGYEPVKEDKLKLEDKPKLEVGAEEVKPKLETKNSKK